MLDRPTAQRNLVLALKLGIFAALVSVSMGRRLTTIGRAVKGCSDGRAGLLYATASMALGWPRETLAILLGAASLGVVGCAAAAISRRARSSHLERRFRLCLRPYE